MFLNNFMRQTCRQLFLQPTRKTGKFQQNFMNSLGIIKDSFSWDSHIFPYQGLPFSHYHISLREPKPENNNNKLIHKERPSLLIISLGPFPWNLYVQPVLIFLSMTARTSSWTVQNISRRCAILTSECQADFHNSWASFGESSEGHFIWSTYWRQCLPTVYPRQGSGLWPLLTHASSA